MNAEKTNDGQAAGIPTRISSQQTTNKRKASSPSSSRTPSPVVANDTLTADSRDSVSWNSKLALVDDDVARFASAVEEQNSTSGPSFEDHKLIVKTPAPSKPIAINLPVPTRKKLFHTPLSARGDLIGGYFPLHESSQQSYEPHPFNKPSRSEDYHSTMKPEALMSTSSIDDPSQYNSPYHPRLMQSPEDRPTSNMNNQISQTPPLISMPPLGKYHPANYQNKSASITLRSPRPQAMPSSRPIPPQDRAKVDMRNNKQLLQKYQRDMVEQATRAARRAGAIIDDPTAPKLTPIGSPGPVTPMELEESNAAGYLVAGAQRGSGYRSGESRVESDMVERMIRGEEERRRREGQSSPLIDC